MPKPLRSVRKSSGIRCFIPSGAIMRENACAGKERLGIGLSETICG